MITPDNTGKAGNALETCIPLAALAIDGVAPGVGDTAEFTASGTVDRIEGEHAYVTLQQVNGQTASAPQGDMDQDDMMKMAEEADEQMP